jgi:DNA processing protein
MPPGNLTDWIALNLLSGLGPILVRRALDRFGDPGEVAFRAPIEAFREIPGIGEGIAFSIRTGRVRLRERAEAEVRSCERLGVRILPFPDPEFPVALLTLADPPVVLFVKGELPEGVVRIAVVGSRRATAYGRRVASGLGAALAARGIEIVSGGARGIDTHAHAGALEAGGRTIAVLGSGLRRPYPTENAGLFDRIAERGAVLSEFPLDAEPLPERFPRRNRILSGLSAAVVVVEAASRSGSLSTAAHALEQGREVMAVPGPISSDLSAGCHRLIQQGAKLVHEAHDILAELSPMYTDTLPASAPVERDGEAPDLTSLSADETAVLALLDDPEPVQLEALADAAPFGIARLQTALFGLQCRGAVEPLPGGFYLAKGRRRS